MKLDLTARMRLTMFLSILFVVTSAVLLIINYMFVRYRIETTPRATIAVSPAEPLLVPPSDGATLTNFPLEFEVVRQRLISASMQELVVQSIIALAIMSIVVVVLNWFVAGRVLRPVQKITTVARLLSEQSLEQRIALEGPQDELKELADTFDIMLERLSTTYSNQQRFAANVSHELRTPLTIIRTEIDVTLGDSNATKEDFRMMAETMRKAVDRSERLIDNLFILGLNSQVIERDDRIDLRDVVNAALRQVASDIRRMNITTHSELSKANIIGNRLLIERMVENLVENAVRYNKHHGQLQVRTSSSDGHSSVQVINTGALVERGKVKDIFIPFRRIETTSMPRQRGFGLGLSIVDTIATAHNAAVDAHACADGGLHVTVTFPGIACPSDS